MTLRLFAVLGALLLASGASAANPVAAIVAHRGTTDVSNNATPFSVFFDAQTTTQAGKSTADVYKELHFRWTFGDATAGTWATGNQQGDTNEKNVAYGPIAAHVFETAGTFTVTLVVTDPVTGETDTDTESIFVDAADTFFSTTNTICYTTAASLGDWEDCPAGATQTTSATWAGIISDAATNKRQLLRGGDTFSSGGGSYGGFTGPGHLGKFGAGARPIIQQTDTKVNLANFSDWRIVGLNFTGACDFEVDGMTQAHNGPLGDVLLMDLAMSNCGFGSGGGFAINLATWGAGATEANQPTHAFLIDTTIVKPANSSSVVGMGGIESVFMGNTVTTSGDDHGMRAPWWRDIIVSHNEVHVTDTFCRGAIKLAPEFISGLGCNGGAALCAHSAIIADNDLTDNDCPAIELSSDEGSETADEGQLGIAERNHIVMGNDSCIRSAMKDGVIRNNVCEWNSSAAQSNEAFLIDPAVQNNTPAGWITDFHLYNNTIHNITATTATGLEGVTFKGGGDTPNSIARNNLFYTPNTTGGTPTVIDNAATESDNIHTTSSAVFSGDPPTGAPASYDLASADAVAQDQVTTKAVLRDFAAVLRTGTHDVGAYEVEGAAPPPDPSPLSGTGILGGKISGGSMDPNP